MPPHTNFIPGRISKTALDGWMISDITTFASGFPQNVALTTSDRVDFTGGGDLTAGVVLRCNPELPHGSRSFSRFFDTSCVHHPGGRGNYGNNSNGNKFRGPGVHNHERSVWKTFDVPERKTLLFRWEVCNVLNKPEADGINTNARFDTAANPVNAAPGTVISTRPERRIEGSIRFTL